MNPKRTAVWIWAFYLVIFIEWPLWDYLRDSANPTKRLLLIASLTCVILAFITRIFSRYVVWIEERPSRCKWLLWAGFLICLSIAAAWPWIKYLTQRHPFSMRINQIGDVAMGLSAEHLMVLFMLLVAFEDYRRRKPNLEMVRFGPKLRR